MSVIVSRALPDVRDGLKPVHRRVLFGMLELGVPSNRAYKKSARIVGEVLGKYHPHGDSSVYDTMVRLAQDWSMRYPDGGWSGKLRFHRRRQPRRHAIPRLRKVAEEMLADLDKETVDLANNFDDSLQEPTVLPAKIPNLLVNGAAGIAVGMATNMPPHNLDGGDQRLRGHDRRPQHLGGRAHAIRQGSGFSHRRRHLRREGVKDAYETGRGRVVMRGKARFEETRTGKEQIIIEEIPYQVNKADMVRKAADLVNEKKIEGISEIRDESDRKGMPVVCST